MILNALDQIGYPDLAPGVIPCSFSWANSRIARMWNAALSAAETFVVGSLLWPCSTQRRRRRDQPSASIPAPRRNTTPGAGTCCSSTVSSLNLKASFL